MQHRQAKASVVERLRSASGWIARYGEPFKWVLQLIEDATHQLESEPCSLWLQWHVRSGHVRVFTEGEMQHEDIQSLINILTLQLEFAERRAERADATHETKENS